MSTWEREPRQAEVLYPTVIQPGVPVQRALEELLQNPQALKDKFGLTEKQAQNVRAFISGGGAAVSLKFLGPVFGEELAGALGGFLGAYLAKRMIGQ